jgi:predicted permease
MSLLDGVRHRLYVLLRGEAYARDQAREVRFHLELEALARALPGGDDAELEARRAFGNIGYYREEMRMMTLLRIIDRLRQSTSYAIRGIRRTPGFSIAVIATVALGVGLNTSMFSLLDRLLLQPPPGVTDPGSVRRLYIDPGYAVTDRGSHVFPHFSYANYRTVREAFRSGDLAAYTKADSLGLDGVTAHLSYVSSNYFSLMGVRPVAGRTFGSDEAAIETPTPVIVISERLWHAGFASDSNILGRTLRMGLLRVTVVGIIPAAFKGADLSAADAWVPLNVFDGGRLSGGNPWYKNGGGNYLTVIARLAPRASEADLSGRGGVAVRQIETQRTGKPDASKLLLGPIIEARGPAEEASELSLSTRIAGVALILLVVACANVATLLLVRATRRRREIAVRCALGASRIRLCEQLLVESLLLAILGGLAALVLGSWGALFLRKLLFPGVNWVGGIVDWRAAGFVGLIVAAVGVVTGIAPAAAATNPDVMNAMRGGSTNGAYRHSISASILLAFQAAFSVVLLVGAGLFIRSFANVRAINVGFDTNRLVWAGLASAPDQQWGPETTPLLAQAAEAIRSVPGVQSTALASPPPMSGFAVTPIYRQNGDSLFRIGNEFPAFESVTPSFFETAGVRLVSGRLFSDADRADAPSVMIVSRKMAGLVWPQQPAIGQCLILGKIGSPCTTVIGVVEDTHRMRVVEDPGIQYYRPLSQAAGMRAASVLVRADPGRVDAVMAALRAQVTQSVPGARLVSIRSLEQFVSRELRPWRLGASLFTAFGLLSLCVAAIGIYSVVAYAVGQRTHEMGVRIALGASVRQILSLVVLDRMAVVSAGVGAGIAAALALGRFVSSLLFGVTTSDPAVMLAAAATLIGTAIVASLVPAWRAARVDPVTALRAD